MADDSIYHHKHQQFRSYVASLTQTGTAAPAATVLEDTLSDDPDDPSIVWTRSGAGVYLGTLAGKFLAGKTFVIHSNPVLINGSKIQARRTSDDVITVSTQIADNTATDAILAHQIEIRVYD